MLMPRLGGRSWQALPPVTESFDSWADRALDAVNRDSSFKTVFPSAHPGQVELTHRFEAGSRYEDFSLALCGIATRSEDSTKIQVHSLSFDKLASLVEQPPLIPPDLSPTGLVPGTREGNNWLVDITHGMIFGYDETRRRGIIAVRNEPPEWEWAAPFRPHLHWAALAAGDALMHGAVVGFPDAALLIVGPGGTGKSTTNFATVDQGAWTCGDDYVWLSKDDDGLVAHSIYGTSKVKRSAAIEPPESMIARRWRDSPALNKRAYYVSLDRPDTFMSSARIVAALTLETSQTRGTSVRTTEPVDLLRTALPSTVLQAPSHQQELLGRLTSMLAALPSFHVILSPDLRESGQAVLDLLNSVAGRNTTTDLAPKNPGVQ